jgi:hypothetical protein
MFPPPSCGVAFVQLRGRGGSSPHPVSLLHHREGISRSYDDPGVELPWVEQKDSQWPRRQLARRQVEEGYIERSDESKWQGSVTAHVEVCQEGMRERDGRVVAGASNEAGVTKCVRVLQSRRRGRSKPQSGSPLTTITSMISESTSFRDQGLNFITTFNST